MRQKSPFIENVFIIPRDMVYDNEVEDLIYYYVVSRPPDHESKEEWAWFWKGDGGEIRGETGIPDRTTCSKNALAFLNGYVIGRKAALA